jgi:hypothetical protein
MFIYNWLGYFFWEGAIGGKKLRGYLKQVYIVMSTNGAFEAMDIIYSGEFLPNHPRPLLIKEGSLKSPSWFRRG